MKDLYKVGIIAVLSIVAMAGVMSFMQQPASVTYPSYPQGPSVAPVAPTGECKGLAQVPCVTFRAFDKYNPGTALTENIMYREAGGNVWTQVAAGSSVSKAPGTTLEIMWGDCDSTPVETMQGPLMTYTYPCKETDTLSVAVANDVPDVGSITETELDELNNAAAQAMSAGDIKNLEITYTGVYEQDYGNIACGEDSNLLVFLYKTANITKITPTSVRRETGGEKSWTPTKVTIPAGISGTNAASGFAAIGYTFPVLESNNKYRLYYVVEADDSNDPVAADVDVFVYDSGYYLDNDDNVVLCGWEDEDQNEVGEDDSNDLKSEPIS